MESRKLTKADLDKVRGIEGFPIGEDEDIIALSDAPYYTACPNPFIEEFIAEKGTAYDETTDNYHREPFTADVSEGKNDPVYNAHSYHTKVPYKAIMRYILHYTEPGDIVFDGFSGTGMTGVAAQMCGSDGSQLSLVNRDENYGVRYAILNDLAPIASFIAHHFNTTVNTGRLYSEGRRILDECEKEAGWMYQTDHTEGSASSLPGLNQKGIINYTIMSDVFICPHCGAEINFGKQAVDFNKKEIKDKFDCPKCKSSLAKKDCEHAMNIFFDECLGETRSVAKISPILINYTYAGKTYSKTPDDSDLEVIERIENMSIQEWYSNSRMCVGKESRRNDKFGITHVHDFCTKRNNAYLAVLYKHIIESEFRDELMFVFTASLQRANKTNRFRFGGTGNLSGTLYIPSLQFERNVNLLYAGKLDDIIKQKNMIPKGNNVIINTGSLSSLPNIPDNSIDYIFTDPPFGDNLNYSELSFIWESWLKVCTDNKDEAIINSSQNKGLVEYQQLMTDCFTTCYRVLKPNRWMTVEFHNSKNAVWNAIQESLNRAGFIVADVRTLDKQQGSFKQVNNSSAVKQDLVISAYKPKESFSTEFMNKAGTEESAWAFVRQHLDNIPVVVINGGKIEMIAERQAYLLFDRMVAYHIMHGMPVPLDASDFYKGLDEKFLVRDGMYFLPDQVNEYDTARIKTDVEPIQFSLFVTNEKTAIAWLYQQLDTPQTYAELQPKFMQEVKSVDKFEAMPELQVILEENFIQDEKKRWYIPDIKKEGDVVKLREKKLWKEFEDYLASKGKLKLFRSEAIRVGFARLWKEKNYKAIVDMAERLPEQTIQEDPNILMYYDISLSRV
ncbi:DNA methyltransferase [Oribacterium sp. FC2011]|uniref:DNA methyltransferase n=1 Tax=Oribacterium sp. FC2011 TaxID=1408311 RepID=UPI0004E23B6D|nr:DNA methyltransferase [Oribacterium sp. FC2011]